ncbi:MAG TPA: protein kinase [Thermoanaerobaculia bacterium]|nr:protein kinase [Thermoanaerobaculia bacterium]
MALAPRTRLGSYEILGSLGSGGMGEVYRAKDLRLGREVAVKVLPHEVASSPDRLARFEREARTVAGLNHPNIVTLFSVEEAGGVRFLTMELVDGRSLADLIVSGGLPVPQVIELSIALADALAAAHEQGVVHRDLKPANVMVTREGRIKVLDFGLAKITERRMGSEEDTRTLSARIPESDAGRLMGTISYMAPEQIRGERVDARTDLFSLGVMIYELATGRRPFSGETWADQTSSILRDTPEPLPKVRADLPGDLDRIVAWCLEKNARDRIQSALDVRHELQRLTQTIEGTAPSRSAVRGVASIAVLPFVNRSRDEGDEYFSDGLADELLDTLGKIRGLRVAARTSSFQFKGTKEDLATIGRRLNVAALLDGSVRKSGNRVRISVQLVKVPDAYHLWSATYDRTLDDVLEVQDDIARSVVKEMRTTLLGENEDSRAEGLLHVEVAKAAKGRSTHPEAHRLYLLAKHLQARWTRQDTMKAIEYLKKALRRDPGFALAWAELCRAYRSQADQTWISVAEGYECARKAAERALALEPALPEAHARMAWIQMSYDWDWKRAQASYARALELAPSSSSALLGAGLLARYLGDLDEAIELHRRILQQDPLSGAAYHNLGWILHDAGRYSEAVEAYRSALELAPQRVITRAQLSLSLAALDRPDEALAEANREPEEAYGLWAQAIVHHGLGNGAASDAALRALSERHADTCAYQIAEAHGARGEVDSAFQWLERAYELRDGGLAHLQASPRLRSLHADPRWDRLLETMGFAPRPRS